MRRITWDDQDTLLQISCFMPDMTIYDRQTPALLWGFQYLVLGAMV